MTAKAPRRQGAEGPQDARHARHPGHAAGRRKLIALSTTPRTQWSTPLLPWLFARRRAGGVPPQAGRSHSANSVVEDFHPLRAALVKGLQEAGYAVDSAADGHDGLARASGEHDVIVLDLMLPRVDGLTVLRELRKAKCPCTCWC